MCTLATVTLSPTSLEISSNAGALILQGPHHSAQKWTTTGLSDFSTSSSKEPSDTGTVAIECSSPRMRNGGIKARGVRGSSATAARPTSAVGSWGRQYPSTRHDGHHTGPEARQAMKKC